MFHHLHVHTEYSALDGICKVTEYAKFLKDAGYSAAVMTDHGNINGTINFMSACAENGLKAIIGCEFYVAADYKDKEKERHHITILAKSKKGYQNLCKLCSIASLEGFYYKPRIDMGLLCENSEGLIALSGCTSGVLSRPFLEEKREQMFKNLQMLKDAFGPDFYLEIMPIDFEPQKKLNLELLKLSKTYKIKLAATNDAHYICEKDAKFQEMILCIGDKKLMSDPTRFQLDVKTLYLANQKEMQTMFTKFHPTLPASAVVSALDTTGEIVDKCEAYTLKGANVMPKVNLRGKYKTSEDHLRALVKAGMTEKGFDKKKEYTARLKEEMSQITEKGYTDYFLLVRDLILWARTQDILVGPGRGSSAGSLVCFLLGITGIDPIIHGTLFFRFIDPNRSDLPDIDIDFEDYRRQEVKDYLIKKYGRENVADIGTFGKLKGKLVLTDLCRIYGVPVWESNEVKKYILERSSADARASYTVEDAFNQFDVCKKFKVKYPQIVEAAAKLEGQIKQYGISAAGVLITDRPVIDYCPMDARGADKTPCSGYDYRNIGYMGLLKMDILGINFLTVINKTLHTIKEKYKKDIDLFNLNLHDKAIYKMIAEKECVGIFQFETPVMNKIAKEIHIDNFDELTACNALVRPGPFRSGSTGAYVKKKQGKQKITFLHPILKTITEETLGELLYQEQVMLMVREIGGFDWKDTNIIRRCMSKSEGVERMQKYEGIFVEGAKEKGFTEEAARRIWKETSFYGAWSFNKSHAVAYSVISYWCAYLKYYYHNEYMLNFINYSTNEHRVFAAVREFKASGYNLTSPKANCPSAKMIIVKGKEVHIGLEHVKGFGEKVVEELLSVRAKNLKEWTAKVTKKTINSRIKKILVNIGYFDCWEKSTGKLNKFFNLTYDKEKEPIEKIEWEYERCPIIYCDNLLKQYEDFLKDKFHKDLIWDSLENIDAGEESDQKGNWVLMKGVMDGINLKNKEYNTGKGGKGLEIGRQDIEAGASQRYCVSDFFDGTGYLRISFYPEVYKRYEREIWAAKKSTAVIFRGTIGPDRIYVKDFINICTWKKSGFTDKTFADKLKGGIRTQQQIDCVIKDIVKAIDKSYPVQVDSLREHQAKNGLMAFAQLSFEDIKIELVIWAQAYNRWKPLFQVGSKISIRFSSFKEGKFYLDQQTGKVEKIKREVFA
jgi:DNA polymerase-3 subunit alpha